MFDLQGIPPKFAETKNPFMIIPQIKERPKIDVLRFEITTAFVVPARSRIEEPSRIKNAYLLGDQSAVELTPTLIEDRPPHERRNVFKVADFAFHILKKLIARIFHEPAQFLVIGIGDVEMEERTGVNKERGIARAPVHEVLHDQ